jgi:MSHA pilin protein MshA
LKLSYQRGFTLIELVTVIVILAVLSAFALPRFANLQQNSRLAVLQGIQGSMRSAIAITRVNAHASGLTVLPNNPGNAAQSSHVIQMEGFSVEVDWRNLCPESAGELGDAKDMYHFISLTEDNLSQSNIHTLSSNIQLWYNNQYTVVGYNIPSNASRGPGCYILYDSFGDPQCTLEMFTSDC